MKFAILTNARQSTNLIHLIRMLYITGNNVLLRLIRKVSTSLILAILLVLGLSGFFAFSTTDFFHIVDSKSSALAELSKEQDVYHSYVSNEEIGLPPTKVSNGKPGFQSSSALIMHLESRTILESKEPDKKLQIASVTKLMTALVALEELDLHEHVKVSENASSQIGATMKLQPNEVIELESLIKGMFLNSGNDAAFAVADYYDSIHGKGNFIKKMNEKAQLIGMSNTHYDNPAGFDSSDNYSTTNDLAKLSIFAMQNNYIASHGSIKEDEVFSLDKTIKHELVSTNRLLREGFNGVVGLKTGQTDDAGQTLVLCDKIDSENTIVIILLNSPDRNEEAKYLINWVSNNYKFNQPLIY